MDSKKKQFKEMYEQFVKAIFRYIYLKVSDYELSEDLTSETFIKYWRSLSRGDEIQNHKAFLYFVAHGLVIDYYRSKKVKQDLPIDNIDEQLLESEDNFVEKIADKQQIEEVLSKLNDLKKEYKDVIILHFVQELEISEIAYIFNKEENAVRVLLHRALKALKGKL